MAAQLERSIIIIATICAFAVPGFAFASCEEDLSIDKRYQALEESGQSQKEKSVGITLLLNEAFTPYLRKLEKEILQTPPEELTARAEKLRIHILDNESQAKLSIFRSQNDFNAVFEGFFRSDKVNQSYWIAAFRTFNRPAMAKLFLAIMVTDEIERERLANIPDGALESSVELRRERTYARESLSDQMILSYLSVMQSVASLTADPVGDWTPENMVKDVMTAHGNCPSLVVLHSLMAPPALIGQNGNEKYRANPIEQAGDHLMITADFRAFIKNKRDKYAQRAPKNYEFFHGCPVGHLMRGESQPGLQSFLNAVVHVFEVIK